MRITRDDFLQALESVSPGLAQGQSAVEQGDNYIFRNGEVMTFNDEVSCRCLLALGKDFTAAVPAKALVEQLRKWKESEIDVEAGEGCLIVRGKGTRKAVFQAESEITLPVEHVERPKKWKPLSADFSEAIKIVSECAKDRDESLAVMSVSIHPGFVEASDNLQLTRYKVDTGVAKFCLVRKEAIKHLPPLDMTEVAETENWLHWRNPAGVVFSARKNYPPEEYGADYWDKYLKKEGSPVVLPKSLAEEADRAEVFARENGDSPSIKLTLNGDGRMKVEGEGASGRYSVRPKVTYKGPSLSFLVSPKLLIELVRRHHEALVSDGKLLVDAGKFVSALCLEKV